MSCTLTKGRSEPLCRDSIGGVKNVYLLNYIPYTYNQIQGVRGVSITDFPSSDLYKYEVVNGNFSETINNDENGINYSQSLTFTLYKQDLATSRELNLMQKIDLRYIVEFNNGQFKMGGVYNGARLDSYTVESGSAKGSLNGYNLTFSSEEEYASPFLNNLPIQEGYLLLEDGFNVLLENSSFIILE
jgi:hypothetical protein